MVNYFVIARNSSFTYKGRAARRPPGRPRAWRPVCHRGQRARPRGQSHSRNRPADRGLIRRACLGGKVRSPARRSCSMSRMKSSAVLRHPRRPKFCFTGDGSRHKPPRPDITTWELAKKAWMAAYGFSRDGHETAIALAKLAVARDPVIPLGYEVLASVQMHFAYMGFAAGPPCPRKKHSRTFVARSNSVAPPSTLTGSMARSLDSCLAGTNRRAPRCGRRSISTRTFRLVMERWGPRRRLSANPTKAFAILNSRYGSIRATRVYSFAIRGLSLAVPVKRDLPAALEWAERSASRNPDWWLAHALVAAVHSMQGKLERARTALDDLRRVLPAATLSNLPWRQLSSGRRARDRQYGASRPWAAGLRANSTAAPLSFACRTGAPK